MTNEQRIAKIDEITNKISPLNYDRIFIETNLTLKKEKYFKTFEDTDKQEILELESKLQDINTKLTPLFNELRQFKCRYLVQYEGLYADANGNAFWQPMFEELLFKTDCQINTMQANGWESYSNDPVVNELIIEIHSFLYNFRYTNIKIKNVKRL